MARDTYNAVVVRMRLRSPILLLAMALLPGWVGALSLALQRGNLAPLIALGALSALAGVAHRWLERMAPARDPFILSVAVMLTGLGLLSIGRTAPNFLERQTIALIIAFAAMLVVASRRDRLRWLRRFKYTWLIAALGLLLVSLVFGVNPAGSGARLWLNIGSFFVQPSELLRLLMIAFLAAYFADRRNGYVERPGGDFFPFRAASMRSLAPSVAMGLVALTMLAVQQDLGAASLLMVTFALMLYLATGDARLPLSLAALLAVAAVVGYFLSARVAQRLSIWLNPWTDPQGSAFQIVQSLIALASGGVFGQGINQGRPDYVPAVHTDFPFVMIGEELGLIGALAVIASFAVLIMRAWRIGLNADNCYGLMLAGGIAAALTVQVFVIIGGNIGLLPLTGVTLPFISYGGTSLVVTYVMVGLLIRLSADEASAMQGNMESPRPLTVRLSAWQAAHRAMYLSAGMLAALALGTGYWSIVRGSELVRRADNPRLVEAERATFRGAIFARDGTLLAYSSCVGAPQPLTPCKPSWEARSSAATHYERHYPRPETAPAVGYYSQRYGVGGLEAFGDAMLRGSRTWLDDLLHRPRIGQALTTTLDLSWQDRANAALRPAPTLTNVRGAVVVLNWRSGEVLALASAPTFDPNRLEEDWDHLRTDPDAPLVNRTTQGLYQPGGLLRWLITARALISPSQSFISDHQSFMSHLASLELHRPVSFELPNEAIPLPATVTYSETVGQGQMRVTPLRVAATLATLAAGRPVTPTLIAGSCMVVRALPETAHAGIRPFSGFAQIADNQFVGWHARIAGDLVIVLALETPTRDHLTLARAIAVLQGDQTRCGSQIKSQ